MREIDLQELKEKATQVKNEIDMIYLHWSAGHYGQFFDDYHIMIDRNGEIMLMHENLDIRLAHTWRRNTGSIAVSFCGAYGAMANQGFNANLGAEPPTTAQIETMAKVVKTLCEALGLPISEEYVMTHEEIATIDDYGPGSGDPQTRWDLWYLPDYDGIMKPGGDVIRGKANWYLNN